ncbi:MAG: hypothetical protein LBE76_03855 [Nitrososphaerota archaeon]|jgi:hypothetical protein|nr:hypothetical protein [Nitrososphaerota archaeon]
MDEIEYSEKVMAGNFVKTFVSVILILATGALILAIRFSFSIGSPLFAVVMALPLVFVSLLYINFRCIKISITSKELIVTYGLLNRKYFTLHEIESCEQVKADFGKYMGVGIRHGTDKSTAYSTSFGNAVKINRTDEKPFVFSVMS